MGKPEEVVNKETSTSIEFGWQHKARIGWNDVSKKRRGCKYHGEDTLLTYIPMNTYYILPKIESNYADHSNLDNKGEILGGKEGKEGNLGTPHFNGILVDPACRS